MAESCEMTQTHCVFVHLIFFSATFLSFNVKEWIIENDLLVYRLKVRVIVLVFVVI